MRGEVALIEEQGVQFAVVCVKPHVLSNQLDASRTVATFSRQFGVPAVLMASDGSQCFGRDDLAEYVSHVPPDALPWREFSMN